MEAVALRLGIQHPEFARQASDRTTDKSKSFGPRTYCSLRLDVSKGKGHVSRRLPGVRPCCTAVRGSRLIQGKGHDDAVVVGGGVTQYQLGEVWRSLIQSSFRSDELSQGMNSCQRYLRLTGKSAL